MELISKYMLKYSIQFTNFLTFFQDVFVGRRCVYMMQENVLLVFTQRDNARPMHSNEELTI